MVLDDAGFFARREGGERCVRPEALRPDADQPRLAALGRVPFQLTGMWSCDDEEVAALLERSVCEAHKAVI